MLSIQSSSRLTALPLNPPRLNSLLEYEGAQTADDPSYDFPRCSFFQHNLQSPAYVYESDASEYTEESSQAPDTLTLVTPASFHDSADADRSRCSDNSGAQGPFDPECLVLELDCDNAQFSAPTEVPLRATHANDEMRSMMNVLRLNPFVDPGKVSFDTGAGIWRQSKRGKKRKLSNITDLSYGSWVDSDDEENADRCLTWCGEEPHPLDKDPVIIEWQIEDYVPFLPRARLTSEQLLDNADTFGTDASLEPDTSDVMLPDLDKLERFEDDLDQKWGILSDGDIGVCKTSEQVVASPKQEAPRHTRQRKAPFGGCNRPRKRVKLEDSASVLHSYDPSKNIYPSSLVSLPDRTSSPVLTPDKDDYVRPTYDRHDKSVLMTRHVPDTGRKTRPMKTAAKIGSSSIWTTQPLSASADAKAGRATSLEGSKQSTPARALSPGSSTSSTLQYPEVHSPSSPSASPYSISYSSSSLKNALGETEFGFGSCTPLVSSSRDASVDRALPPSFQLVQQEPIRFSGVTSLVAPIHSTNSWPRRYAIYDECTSPQDSALSTPPASDCATTFSSKPEFPHSLTSDTGVASLPSSCSTISVSSIPTIPLCPSYFQPRSPRPVPLTAQFMKSRSSFNLPLSLHAMPLL